MDFVAYITYEEYVELGGDLPEDKFNLIERKAQRWLDSFTFNRIQKLAEIPVIVKECLVEYISRLNIVDSQRESGDVITSYSNGVETFNYQLKSDKEVKKELNNIAIDWLPNYLVYRGVNFDVEKYLQSESYNT